MIITNNHRLPDPLFEAVRLTCGAYDKGDADFSVTELVDPPQIGHLKRQYDGGSADAMDMLPAFIVLAVHKAIEVAPLIEGSRREERVNLDVLGKKVSGKFDHWAPSWEDHGRGSWLFDWKTVKLTELSAGPKPEKIAQINVYAHMIEQTLGLQCDNLGITLIGLDWSRPRSQREFGYPEVPCRTVRVDRWMSRITHEYLEERVRLHSQPKPRPCTHDERWVRGGPAVMKQGGKRALKLFPLQEHGPEAMAMARRWVEAQKDKEKLYIEDRPVEYVRCESYCSVAAFCPQNKG